MEQRGNNDHTENGWMTSGNGVRKPLYTNSIELHMLDTSGILLMRQYQAPMGVEPMVIMMVMVTRFLHALPRDDEQTVVPHPKCDAYSCK